MTPRAKTDTSSQATPGGSSPRRAIGYLRVSTSRQADKGMGLEAQRQRVSEHAKEQGLELVELTRESASGAVKEGEVFSHTHRPILSTLIERAGRGEYDVLIVAAFDRLSRDYMTLVFLKRLLKSYGIDVVSASEDNGNGDPFGELVEQIIASIAQFERERILERMRGGKEQKKRLGRHVHGRVPYGYRSDAGALEPDKETTPIVRRIFRDAKDGWTPARIARELNNDGVAAPQGTTWSRQTVSGILSNPVYAGERYGVKRAHTPLVTRRAWNAVQRHGQAAR